MNRLIRTTALEYFDFLETGDGVVLDRQTGKRLGRISRMPSGITEPLAEQWDQIDETLFQDFIDARR